MRPFGIAALILAAGASRRMGRPKLLLPWGDTTIIGHLVRQWTAVGVDQVAIVLAANDPVLPGELDRLEVKARIFNAKPELGMFSSIQCAARWSGWNADVTHVAVALGDQPQLQQRTLESLLAFAAGNPARISQPSRNGRGRHPVVIPRSMFPALADSNASNLKEFMLAQPELPARIEIADGGLDLDLDTPVDYERAVVAVDRGVGE